MATIRLFSTKNLLPGSRERAEAAEMCGPLFTFEVSRGSSQFWLALHLFLKSTEQTVFSHPAGDLFPNEITSIRRWAYLKLKEGKSRPPVAEFVKEIHQVFTALDQSGSTME